MADTLVSSFSENSFTGGRDPGRRVVESKEIERNCNGHVFAVTYQYSVYVGKYLRMHM